MEGLIIADVQKLDTMLIELEAHTGSSVETLRFCDGNGIIVDGHFYLPRISNPGSIRNFLHSEGTTSGQSSLGYGIVTFLNSDGALDYLRTYGIAGRVMNIKKVIAGVAVLLASCSMEQPVMDFETVSIRIKDPQMIFDEPIQPTKYGGTNVLPDGVDGTDDIKGKEKPLLYGIVNNATPERVNTSREIYQVNDGPVQDVSAVYTDGVKFNKGPVYTSFADMMNNPPEPATFRAYLAGGYFRIGSSAGRVTFDAVEGSDPSARTAAQIAKRIALRKLLIADIDDQSFTDLDVKNNAEVGIYIKGPKKYREAINEVLGSIGAEHAFDSSRKLYVTRLEDHSNKTPDLTITQDKVLNMLRQETNDEGKGVPTGTVVLDYHKNWTVQTELAGSVKDQYNWVKRDLPLDVSWSKPVYGNGLFVMGTTDATSTTYTTSPDGITWTLRAFPVAGMVVKAYGAGLFLATVGGGSNYYTSPDGITWTARAHPGGTSYQYHCVNNLFISTASANTLAYTSTNGINWTPRNFPNISSIKGVAYGSGKYLMITQYGSDYVTSDDGVTWTKRAFPESTLYWSGVVYGNGRFIVFSDPTLYLGEFSSTVNINLVSFDGLQWGNHPHISPVATKWRDFTFGEGVFMAVAFSPAGYATSLDGTVWINRQVQVLPVFDYVTYGGGTFLASNDRIGLPACATYSAEISASSRNWHEKEFRTVAETDGGVYVQHLNAVTRRFQTLIISQAAAQMEAARLLDLHKVPRDFFIITCKRSELPAILPRFGRVIRIVYPRFGCDTGRNFIFLGYDQFFGSDDIKLYIWG